MSVSRTCSIALAPRAGWPLTLVPIDWWMFNYLFSCSVVILLSKTIIVFGPITDLRSFSNREVCLSCGLEKDRL